MATATKRKPAKKARDEWQGCDCIDLVNKELKRTGSNTRVSYGLQMNFKTGKARAVLYLPTERADPKKKGKLDSICCTYCPFCGKKIAK